MKALNASHLCKIETVQNFCNRIMILTTFCCCLQPVEVNDDIFWDQFWSDSISNVNDIFALIPAAEIRTLREECPSNLATLCYKVSF